MSRTFTAETVSPDSNKLNLRLDWVDQLKGLAILWILVNHIGEQIFGGPYFANPSMVWPPLAERIAQIQPLTGYGLWNWLVNGFRYISWTGDQGVQLFLILSGFGLAWGQLSKRQAFVDWRPFYIRRFERIYPLWWGIHIFFTITWLLIGRGLSLLDYHTYLSFLGIRFTPGLFYYFAPAWWYFGLILQLYALYPFLWRLLQRWGPTWLLAGSLAVTFVSRWAGIVWLSGFMDPWLRGAFLITRLGEFVLGVSLAAWLFQSPDNRLRKMQSYLALIGALFIYLVGTGLSFTLYGNIFSTFLTGAGAFFILASFLIRLQPGSGNVVVGGMQKFLHWTGDHSYSVYLTHHPFVTALIPLGLALSGGMLGRILIAVLAAFVSGLGLEYGVNSGLRFWSAARQKWGLAGLISRLGVVVALGIALLFAADQAVRRFDPQETLGWGERPSLIPDPEIGWRLNPSSETHLRWKGYDYIVQANELGFPGPAYIGSKPAGMVRIMTTGDAFTSAEGVNTSQAWPRLMEETLKANTGKDVQVVNFAVTGYGPRQYADVISKYAPDVHPNVILMEFFVNDFQDVFISNEDFQASIGFGLAQQGGLKDFLTLTQFREEIRLRVTQPMKELLTGKPAENGYLLGNFPALEKGDPDQDVQASKAVLDQMTSISAIANQIGAKLVVVMVPASVQVCTYKDLSYYPRGVDLTDPNLFDMDKPQRMMEAIALQKDIPYVDLRPVLQNTPQGCPYRTENMHWKPFGHQLVSEYLARWLADHNLIGGK
jgi:peptidoglycan/LPS O-acetylase OafA/YrhL